MRYIKHNVIENFNQSSPREKAKVLVEEMSKAYMLYPQAIADVLDSTNIKYESKHPQDLADAVRKNSNNLKMLNRVVKISFLVNKHGVDAKPINNRNISFREVMRKGKPFLKQYPNELKESTLIARDMMKENMYSKVLDKTMTNYLNMDGQEQKSMKLPVPTKSYATTFIVLGIIALGVIAYYKKYKA
jgi:hypothetical protein